MYIPAGDIAGVEASAGSAAGVDAVCGTVGAAGADGVGRAVDVAGSVCASNTNGTAHSASTAIARLNRRAKWLCSALPRYLPRMSG